MSGSSWLLVSILFIAIPHVICCVDMMSCYDYFSVPSGVDKVDRAVTRLSHTEVVTVTMSNAIPELFYLQFISDDCLVTFVYSLL